MEILTEDAPAIFGRAVWLGIWRARTALPHAVLVDSEIAFAEGLGHRHRHIGLG